MKTQTPIPDGIKIDENGNTQKMVRFLAHEINNPLSRIFMCVEELKKSADENNDSYFYVNVIGESGKNIESILSDFIKAITTSEVKLKKRNLSELVKYNLSIAFEKTDHQLIKLVENYPDTNIEVEIDEEKLSAVLQNVIVNAIESIGEKIGSIEIEVAKREQMAVIFIRDNGCGMSAEVKENLFVPFYSTKPKRKGLGLTTAQRIILAHNGMIEFKSAPGAGTEFSISLPLY
jgi:signal transduction histidine kinase